MALRTVGVRLAAEVSGYISNLRTAKRATSDFAAELNRAAKAGNLDAVADQARNMGLALTAGFGAVVAVGAKFDQQMSAVQAATHATAAEMEQLRQAALQAGADTSFSATEAAQGIEELAKAGISTGDVLRGGLRGALDLAAAGGIDVAEAAETAASAMTQFRLKGRDVPHVADLLAAAAGKAQGSVRDLSYALSQSGLVASQTGLTIEETTGALAAFASAGLLGSDAGTSFKTMLQRLVAPSGEAARKMQELGIRAFDAQGRFIGLEKFAGNLQTALSGLTDEQRNAALATIFGSDAIRAASVIYQQGEQGIRDWIKAVNDQGYAAETAAARTDNLMGDIERLTGSLETLAIESSTGANQGLRVLVQAADALVGEFSELNPTVGSTVTVLAGLSGVSLLAFAGWAKMRRATAEALDQLRQVGPMGQRAARGLEATSRWAGRAAGAFAALQVAGALVSSMQEDLNPQIEAMAEGLRDFGRGGALAGESARILGEDLKDLRVGLQFLADTDSTRKGFVRWGQDVLETVVPGLDGTNTSLTRTRERIRALDAALAGLVEAGRTDDATAAFKRLAAAVAADGVSVEELMKLLPQYAGALEVAAKGGDKTARAQQDAAETAGNLTGSWKNAAKAANGLREAFEKLNGAAIDWADAEIDIEQAFDDLTEAIKENKRTLDVDTKAGRENKEAILAVAKSIGEGLQARFDHVKSLQGEAAATEDVVGLYKTYRQRLIDALVPLTGTRKEAEQLVDTYLQMPTEIHTKATLTVPPPLIGPPDPNTIKRAAEAAARDLQRELNRYRLSVPVRPSGGPVKFLREGGIFAAQSGLLREPAVFAPRAPAMFAFAEPETGGEAFVPRIGNRTRALGILAQAAQWHKASIVPWERMAAMGGGGITVERLEVRAYSDKFRLKQVMDDLAMHGVH